MFAMTVHKAGPVLRKGARAGGRLLRTGAKAGVRRVLPAPPPIESVPEGHVIDLPGRGRVFVVDVPGPHEDAPTVVLLHALGCTAYLNWVGVLGELSQHYRVVTFDQRWHGRGIRSDRFRFTDCADDVVGVMDALGIDRAIVAGYSMGGAVAQLTWVRHRERVAGLVLCSTARNYRGKSGERFFFPVMTVAMNPLSRYALNKVEVQLGETAYLAGDAYTLADINFYAHCGMSVNRMFPQFDVDSRYPNLVRWRESLSDRPAVQAALASEDRTQPGPGILRYGDCDRPLPPLVDRLGDTLVERARQCL